MPVTHRYEARDLDEVAGMFDSKAREADQAVTRAPTIVARTANAREAQTWRIAADMLRCTKLTGDPT